jgi:hypothetical protein
MNFKLYLYIIAWFLFTSISAIYTKLYLNKTGDSFTFTLITFSYGAVLKLLHLKFNQLKDNLTIYFHLSILNAGSLFLTNVSFGETSIAFVYMVKVIL